MADNRKISRIKIGSETYDLKVPTLPLENLVDGNATASVRGVGTAEESSSYSMGQYAFAEGYATKASGTASHAEGYNTLASGNYGSHTEGSNTEASGDCSHAEGVYTLASSDAQHVEGRYNVEDTNNKYAHIIGNGTGDNKRSNAFTVDWDGNVNIASGAKYKINGNNLSYSDVGAASSGHTHTTSIADSTGTSSKTLALGGKYSLTAGGTSYIFTMPAKPTYTYSDVGAAASDHNHDGVYLKTAPVTSVNSKTGAVTISASDVGLGNVGNFKAVSTVANQGLTSTEQSNARANIGAGTSSLTIGTTATTAAAGNHTHSASITTSTGTSSVTLASNAKYKLTTGGTSVIFTMPTIPTVPTATGNSETGISISDHGTTSVGSASSWNAGTASTWAFEEVSIPNVTSAGSASTWTFSGVTVANSIAGAVDSTDSSQLNITLGTTSVQSKSGGSNGTAPTLGTAIKVQSKKSGANSTVPSLKITSTTVVNGKTHSITDNGHTHTI